MRRCNRSLGRIVADATRHPDRSLLNLKLRPVTLAAATSFKFLNELLNHLFSLFQSIGDFF